MLGTRKAVVRPRYGPSQSARAKSRPSVGTARTALAAETSQRPRPVWPTQSPIGTAIASAKAMASAV